MTTGIISIIIPNYNGANLLKRHLPKVIKSAKDSEIIIVDDASDDDSISTIKIDFPNIQIIALNKHNGFSACVNIGVMKSKGSIVVLLNTDVVPEEDFLQYLIPHFNNANVFAVGCLELSHENEKIITRGRGIARWEKGYYIHARGEVNKKNTAWVSGGSGAFRKSIWNKIGGFDELYSPFYWEDIDLSYRARKIGYDILFEEKSIVHHYHQKGAIQSKYSLQDIKKISYRNQYIFIWKNLTDKTIFCEHLFWTPIRLLQSLLRFDFVMLVGFIGAIAQIPNIIKHRKNFTKFNTRQDQELNL